MAFFRYIGEPEKKTGTRLERTPSGGKTPKAFVVCEKGDGPPKITKFGHTFEKNGAAVEVPDLVAGPPDEAGNPTEPLPNRAVMKLRGCNHFVEEKPVQAKKPDGQAPKPETTKAEDPANPDAGDGGGPPKLPKGKAPQAKEPEAKAEDAGGKAA